MNGGIGVPGSTSVWKVPEHFAPTDLHRPDLGYPAIDRRPAGGLQVEHAEGHVVEGRAEVLEAGLDGEGHPAEPTSNICSGSRIEVVGGGF